MLSRENKSLHNNSINEEHSTLNLLNNTIISPLTGRSTVEDNQRKVEAQSRSEQFARTTLPVPLSSTPEVLLKKFPDDDVKSTIQIHTGNNTNEGNNNNTGKHDESMNNNNIETSNNDDNENTSLNTQQQQKNRGIWHPPRDG